MPFNRHRRPIKIMVNRQYGLGNSKYVVILNPLPTSHVTRSMRSEVLAYNMGKCNFEALLGYNRQPIGNGISDGHVTDDFA